MKNRTDCLQLTAQAENLPSPLAGIPTGIVLLLGVSVFLYRIFPAVSLQAWQTLGITLLLFSLLLTAAYFGKGEWCALGVIILTAAFCAAFYPRFSDGIRCLANDLTDALTPVTGKIYLSLTVSQDANAVWGFVPLLCVLTVLVFLSLRTRKLLFTLPILLAVYCGTYFGLFSFGFDTALIGIGTFLLMMHCVSGKTNALSFVAPTAITVCTAFLAAAIASCCATDGQFADRFVNRLHTLRYHESTNSMPEGKLSDLSSWEKSDTPALKITMSAPEKIYLRGSIYEIYDGSAWRSAEPQDTAEYESLFYWLHNSDFFGQAQIGLATAQIGGRQTEEMTIETLSACSAHGYYPYAVVADFDAAFIGDTTLPQTKSVQYYMGSVPEWYALQSDLANTSELTYLSAENAYSEYVNETDLELTDESFAVLERLFGDDHSPKTLAEIRSLIVNALDELIDYNEDAVTHCGSTDFLQYTLEGSKIGYSVHYATAATLMLRYFGVPARYVEGYYLSAEDAAAYSAGEEIILTENNAHAWAEYYLSGVGFVPFEVTPQYIGKEEWALGTDAAQDETQYLGDHLRYAQVQKPEEIKEPHAPTADYSAVTLRILALLLLFAVLFFLLSRRVRFRKAIAKIDTAPNREAIALRYGYALRLLQTCGVSAEEHSYYAELNREALFSDHSMSESQRREMDAYAAEILKQCRNKWTLVQKIRYRFVQCLY